jgi:cell division protein FtsX
MHPGQKIDYALFNATKIKSAVEAIRARPPITHAEFSKRQQEAEVLQARFDEVTKMMQPLEASYVRVMEKQVPNYDPSKDKNLHRVNEVGGARHEALLQEILAWHETWKKVVAAREARAYLIQVLTECQKFIDLERACREVEYPPT